MPAPLQKRSPKGAVDPAPMDALRTLFGPPPLIDGETEATYDAFAAQVRAAVAPADALEEIWTRDVVDLVWEVQRLRRLKGKYLQATIGAGLDTALRPLVSYSLRNEYVEGWERCDHAIVKEVNDTLSHAGLDMEHVTALALANRVDVFEKMDRLIAAAEARRNHALRELEHRRESLARRLQTATQIIEDAEFHEVAPDAAS